MNAYLDLATFVIKMAFLAIVLGAVGYGVRNFLNTMATRSHAEKTNQEAVVAGARARAKARQAHA